MLADQVLISLPPAMSDHFAELEKRGADFFVCCDPTPLGSGGGTANILVQAWRSSQCASSFSDWLNEGRKIVIHSGGQSRRLPAYAAVGKALIPIPIERGSLGQKFDQCLLDLQLEALAPILSSAPEGMRVLILSGDALTRMTGERPKIEDSDVALLGFPLAPKELSAFGAFFTKWDSPEVLDFALQKPTASETIEIGKTRNCFADAGIWLLSANAVQSLLLECGWDENGQDFASGKASEYDLYGEFLLKLGKSPTDGSWR